MSRHFIGAKEELDALREARKSRKLTEDEWSEIQSLVGYISMYKGRANNLQMLRDLTESIMQREYNAGLEAERCP